MVFKGRPPIERRVREQFWECLRAGQDTVSAACEVQVSLTQMRRWLVQVGGVRLLSVARGAEQRVGVRQ
ncbi:hypothetical protein [Rhodococcus sp. ACPA1]|uniref:hypothetical protein n=1 Tax=Rhodococcus sp. ACPA1 TaxID=2028572 RepID=UPI00117A2384|nr:hypothetical protein [Rhodococcus sp. ACPA1]